MSVIVIKIGSSSICDESTSMPKLSNLSLLVETVASLRALGHKVMLVSSGAVAVGMLRMNLSKRPKHISQIQALAAIGQGRLMALYDSLFANCHIPIAQILLTRDNLAEMNQYESQCRTLKELLEMHVVPIINENDAVTSTEIRFGDNDSLSAIAAGMVSADFLFLLTDVDALYTDNPRTNPEAMPLRIVRDIDQIRSQIEFESMGSALGTGGMVTKLIAAELATSAGCSMVITLGSEPQRIVDILSQVNEYNTSHEANKGDLSEFAPTIGTHFLAKAKPLPSATWDVLHGLGSYGAVYVDAGAYTALSHGSRSSVFAAGITHVEGSFAARQSVDIRALVTSPDGVHTISVGRGLVNYSSLEIAQIAGAQSTDIADILGYVDTEFVIHAGTFNLRRSCCNHSSKEHETHTH
jgi:glutamate 5-kinase